MRSLGVIDPDGNSVADFQRAPDQARAFYLDPSMMDLPVTRRARQEALAERAEDAGEVGWTQGAPAGKEPDKPLMRKDRARDAARS